MLIGYRPVLSELQVNMIAFSGCIGVGLFLQSGQVIFIAGPGLAIISFALAATVMWAVMGSLGEMTALFPVQVHRSSLKSKQNRALIIIGTAF
jgi:amino acid permease